MEAGEDDVKCVEREKEQLGHETPVNENRRAPDRVGNRQERDQQKKKWQRKH